MPTPADTFYFLSTREYFEELTVRIRKSGKGDRIVLATMTLMPMASAVRGVMDELCNAARRGVNVELIVDAKPFLLPGGPNSIGVVPGPLFYNVELPLRLQRRYRDLLASLDGLQDAGGTYKIVNKPGRRFSNPLAGRSHLKFATINDDAYVGGCNLDVNSHSDVMVRWRDSESVQWLSGLTDRIMDLGDVESALDGHDAVVKIGEDIELILDAGVRGQSSIFQKALGIIDDSSEFVVVVSQFFPNDAMGRHLLAAKKRGVKVHVVFNHPGKFGLPHNFLHYGVIGRAKLTYPPEFFENIQRKGFLHAKAILSDTEAMVGSHNLVQFGVKLGTAELDIASRNVQFRSGLLKVLERQIGKRLVTSA